MLTLNVYTPGSYSLGRSTDGAAARATSSALDFPVDLPGSWTNLSLAIHPSARLWEGLVYDAVDREFVLFGGLGSGNPSVLGDTWTFQNGTWTNLTPGLLTAPSPRFYPGMTWDPTIGAVLMFGGQAGRLSFSDTWSFVHGRWTNLTATVGPAPSGRSYAAMAYDSTDRVTLLFGGFNESPLQEYGDTWEFSGGRWMNLTSGLTIAPSARPDAGIMDDPGDGYLLVFGGDTPRDTTPFFNDTWGFAHGRWTNLTNRSPSAPSGREDPAAGYDLRSGFAIMSGGTTTPGVPDLSDTWSYTGLRWTNLTAELRGSPPPRGGARMAYDPVGDRFLLFGGVGRNVFGDTWVLTFLPEPRPISNTAPSWVGWIILAPAAAGTAAAVMLVGIRRRRKPPSGLEA